VSTNKTTPRRRTARAWARLVAAWQKSGKSADEFAASRGIAPRTLTWWRWRLGSKPPSPPSAPLRLVPIQVEPSPPATATPTPQPDATPAWELVAANGHVLRVHRGIAASDLAAVLAALAPTEGRR
jgi:transposase